MLDVREPTSADFRKALPDVRFNDMAEWYAGTGQLFQFSAMRAVLSKGYRKVILEDGLPLCFWGVDWGSPVLGLEDVKATAWMFATNTAQDRFFPLHRILKPNLDEVLTTFGTIDAFADERNVVHHTWMKWLGFKQLETHLIGPLRMPFIRFRKEP